MTRFRRIGIAHLAIAAVMAVPALAAVNVNGVAFAAEIGLSAPKSGGGDGCNPGRSPSNFTSNPFYEAAASEGPGSTPGGIYADILSYSPFVAGPNQGSQNNDADSAWVMIQDDTADWLQVGWAEGPGGGRSTFYQAGINNKASAAVNFAPTAINSTHQYTALYSPTGTAHFKVQMDSDTPLYVGMSWVPDMVSLGVESQDQSSQFPGGSFNAEALSNGHIWPNAGTSSGWRDLSAGTYLTAFQDTNPTHPPSWLNYQPFKSVSTDFLDTWDSACGA